jgi:hypothetical protein
MVTEDICDGSPQHITCRNQNQNRIERN